MVQMLLVSRSSCRAPSNSPSSSWPRYLWADRTWRSAYPQGDAGLGHPSPVGPSAAGKVPTPQKALSFVMKPYVLPTRCLEPGHNLRPPGHCASSGVKGLDSASCITCRLCDFGQVITLSGLMSFFSKMRCLDHISDFAKF